LAQKPTILKGGLENIEILKEARRKKRREEEGEDKLYSSRRKEERGGNRKDRKEGKRRTLRKLLSVSRGRGGSESEVERGTGRR